VAEGTVSLADFDMVSLDAEDLDEIVVPPKLRPKYFRPPDDDFFLQFMDPLSGDWDDDQTAYADGEY
jgi:hypothetical protein